MTTPAGGAIASAFVDILPNADEAKFEAALDKIGSILGKKVADAFNKTNTQATKATGKVKDLGAAGEKAGHKVEAGQDHAAAGFRKAAHALEDYEHKAHKAEGQFERLAKRVVEAFSIYEVARFVKESVEVSEAFERTNRVVEQAIKTTGGAAGLTVKQFDDLGEKISLTTGIAETAVNKATQQLLAFTNIRNEAGKGNDVFNRAAQAIQDIGVRTGLGTVSVARSLGKALEDPAKASLVLRRASILLTKTQQEQIKTFEESGNILGAQGVVLDAIEGKFGGAAEAAATPLKKLAVVTDLVKRRLGESLTPVIEKFVELITSHQAQILAFVDTIGNGLEKAIAVVEPIVAKLVETLVNLFHTIKDSPALTALAEGLGVMFAVFLAGKEIVKAFTFVLETFGKVAALVGTTVEGAFVFNPIGIALLAVAGLVAGLVIAYQHSEKFRQAVKQLGDYFKGLFASALMVVRRILVTDILPALEKMWKTIQKNVLPVLEKLGKFIVTYIVVEFRLLVALIKNLLLPVLGLMVYVFEKTILPILNQFWKIFRDYILPAISGFIDFVRTKVVPAVKTMADVFLTGFAAIVGAAASVAGALGFGGLKDKLNAVKDGIKGFKADLDAIAKDPINFQVNLAINTHSDAFAASRQELIQAALAAAVKAKGGHGLTPEERADIIAKVDAEIAARNKAIKDAAGKQEPLGPKPPIDPSGATDTTKKKKGVANLTELVRELMNRLNTGLIKGSTAASQAISALEQKVRSTLKGTLQEGLTSRTLSFIESQRNALVGLAGQYFKVSKQTDALKKRVDVLRKAAEDFKASVIDALKQTADLDAFFSERGTTSTSDGKTISSGGGVTIKEVASMVAAGQGQAKQYAKFLFDQATQLKNFSANINTLISRIGDTAFVQDLASKGLASAGLVASLAQASTGTLKQINELQSKILTLQRAVADAAGKKLQTSADKANALLTKSSNTQDKMLAKLNTMAHDIVAGIASALGTKVPKFAEGGFHTSPGFGFFGEAGAEVTIPLTRPKRARELLAQAGLSTVSQTIRQGATKTVTNYNSFTVVPQGDPLTHAHQLGSRIAAWSER